MSADVHASGHLNGSVDVAAPVDRSLAAIVDVLCGKLPEVPMHCRLVGFAVVAAAATVLESLCQSSL